MSKKSFYVLLPSNTKTYTDIPNYTSHYRVLLPSEQNLDKEKWEVALAQINFPISWYIINSKKYYIKFYPRAVSMGISAEERTNRIPRGNYQTSKELVDVLNDIKGEEVESYFRLTKLEKIALVVAPYEHVALSPKLATLLGFTYSQKPGPDESPTSMEYNENFLFSHNNSNWTFSFKLDEEHPKTFVANDHSNIIGNVYNIYVYCNIVEPTLVGDAYVPLLDAIGIGDIKSKYISLKYENPHYMRLLTGNFQEIEIKLCDDIGDLLKFKWGKVLIKLHFRQQ